MSQTFWTEHQVGGPYQTLAESLDALVEREKLYPGLSSLMPTDLPGATVLDYGCGPGHDTIMFLRYGADHVYYADASPLAHKTTKKRLALHGFEQRATAAGLFQPVRVTHIHCAGVLHHLEDPLPVLHHFARVIGSGEARVMVYDGDRSTHSQSEVPVTHWWGEAEFKDLAGQAGLQAEYMGGYDCSAEWRPDCQAACYRLTA